MEGSKRGYESSRHFGWVERKRTQHNFCVAKFGAYVPNVCSLIIQQQILQSLYRAPKFAYRRHGNIDLPLHYLFDMCSRCSVEGELNGHQLLPLPSYVASMFAGDFPFYAAAFPQGKNAQLSTAEYCRYMCPYTPTLEDLNFNKHAAH